MRNDQQIQKIKSSITDPYAVADFISPEDVESLLNIFSQGEKIYKNTGPVTLSISSYLEEAVFKKIISKITQEIGEFEITAGLFFHTDYPHIIHNDDTFELPDNVYKGITLPLFADGPYDACPKLCFFDQLYFHGPAKFFNGDDHIPTHYNQQVYNYKDVDGITHDQLVDHKEYFTHLKPQWLQGLSLLSAIDWRIGSAIIFDSVRLHCASDFRKLGIRSKIGISIFTKRK